MDYGVPAGNAASSPTALGLGQLKCPPQDVPGKSLTPGSRQEDILPLQVTCAICGIFSWQREVALSGRKKAICMVLSTEGETLDSSDAGFCFFFLRAEKGCTGVVIPFD